MNADLVVVGSGFFGLTIAERCATELGLKVLVWTINDPVVMSRMLDLGVDGLITDRPDLAVPLLRSRGLRW